ncbi:MAG TPA: fluoride efflux transporter CrcB [Thermoleophilaceae bacterium]
MDRWELAAIFAGGFAGALARHGLNEALPAGPGQWPWATFMANIAGAFLLGCFATGLASSSYRRPLLTSGFCGALTTFSTLQLELLRILDRGELGLAFAYVGLSLALGLAAVLIATRLVRRAQVPV